MENKRFWESLFLILILVTSISLFGTSYGLTVNLVNTDIYEKIKGQLTIILIVNAVVISVLAVLSLMLIQSEPSMFQPYILSATHLSLFVSLLSLSYTVLRVSN